MFEKSGVWVFVSAWNAASASAPAIFHLVHRFCHLHSVPKARGRPPRYSEAVLLTLAPVHTRDRASYRRVRYTNTPDARWQQLLQWWAQQGLAWVAHPIFEYPQDACTCSGS